MIEEVKDIMTEKDLMELLGVESRTTMLSYRSMGLAYIKLGGKVFYLKKDVIDFLEDRKIREV